jgi:hypothetical protein
MLDWCEQKEAIGSWPTATKEKIRLIWDCGGRMKRTRRRFEPKQASQPLPGRYATGGILKVIFRRVKKLVYIFSKKVCGLLLFPQTTAKQKFGRVDGRYSPLALMVYKRLSKTGRLRHRW